MTREGCQPLQVLPRQPDAEAAPQASSSEAAASVICLLLLLLLLMLVLWQCAFGRGAGRNGGDREPGRHGKLFCGTNNGRPLLLVVLLLLLLLAHIGSPRLRGGGVGVGRRWMRQEGGAQIGAERWVETKRKRLGVQEPNRRQQLQEQKRSEREQETKYILIYIHTLTSRSHA